MNEGTISSKTTLNVRASSSNKIWRLVLLGSPAETKLERFCSGLLEVAYMSQRANEMGSGRLCILTNAVPIFRLCQTTRRTVWSYTPALSRTLHPNAA